MLLACRAGRHSCKQAEALVTGFHGAFLGGAVLFVAGIVVLLTMLRRDDVAEVDTEKPIQIAA